MTIRCFYRLIIRTVNELKNFLINWFLSKIKKYYARPSSRLFPSLFFNNLYDYFNKTEKIFMQKFLLLFEISQKSSKLNLQKKQS